MISVIVGVAIYSNGDTRAVQDRISAFIEFAKCVMSQRNCAFELIIVEQLVEPSEGPYFGKVIRDNAIDCQYRLIKHPVFNKSWILNVGASLSAGDILAFSDADIIFGDDYFSLLELALGRSYLIGWNIAPCLNRHATALYVKEPKYKTSWSEDEVERVSLANLHGSAGLVDVFRRDFYFDKLGGWNETFFCGGGSDSDLMLRAYTASGEVNIMDYTMVHLGHVRQQRPERNQEMWRITKVDPARISQIIIEEGCGDPQEPRPLWSKLEV